MQVVFAAAHSARNARAITDNEDGQHCNFQVQSGRQGMLLFWG
jgi:hypothetical protein